MFFWKYSLIPNGPSKISVIMRFRCMFCISHWREVHLLFKRGEQGLVRFFTNILDLFFPIAWNCIIKKLSSFNLSDQTVSFSNMAMTENGPNIRAHTQNGSHWTNNEWNMSESGHFDTPNYSVFNRPLKKYWYGQKKTKMFIQTRHESYKDV